MSMLLMADVMRARLPTGPKFVLLAVANFADEDNTAWPSHKKIAEITGQTLRTIVSHMQWLEDAGLITRQTRLRPDGGQTSNLIFVRVENLARRCAKKDRAGGATDAHQEPVSKNLSKDSSLRSESPPDPPTATQSEEAANTELARTETKNIPAGGLEEAARRWNDLAGDLGLPKVQRLNDTRRKRLRQRLAECGGLEGWDVALAKVRASPFLRGDKTDWNASFDFLLQESSFTKLMEGTYDDKPGTGPRRGQPASFVAAARKASAAYHARSGS
jgi:hypothetical protein